VTISRGGRTVLTVQREAEIATTTRSPNGAVTAPAMLEQIVPGGPGEEVRRLAEMLKSHPPRLVTSSAGTKIFMRDLAAGQTTLIANTSSMGLPLAEVPDWSHDGRRILFRAKRTAPGPSRMIILESRDGRPSFRDLGSGDCPRFSPDDQTIAFALYADETSGDVWLMNADGTNRRRLCEFAAPFWSPDGTQILLDGLLNPTISKVYSFATNRTTRINVPGRSIFSWPRWVAPDTLVACIGEGVVPDSIVILDISRPAEAKVMRTLWNHGAASDVYARWPLISPSSGNLFFIADERHMRTLFSVAPNAGGSGRPSALEVGGPKLSGLSFSPDSRYLLFASDWLGSESSREAAD
jgi:Tol biopolymer transport system component